MGKFWINIKSETKKSSVMKIRTIYTHEQWSLYWQDLLTPRKGRSKTIAIAIRSSKNSKLSMSPNEAPDKCRNLSHVYFVTQDCSITTNWRDYLAIYTMRQWGFKVTITRMQQDRVTEQTAEIQDTVRLKYFLWEGNCTTVHKKEDKRRKKENILRRKGNKVVLKVNMNLLTSVKTRAGECTRASARRLNN